MNTRRFNSSGFRFGLIACMFFMAAPVLSLTVCAAPRAIWKINIDGTGLTRFAGASGNRCASPEWSPDGKYVAFDTWPDKKSSLIQVAVVGADGAGLRLLGHGAMPYWSPDGKQIICQTFSNPYGVVVMNTDGSGREPILNHLGSPRWSPRGNRIATNVDDNIALYDLATAKEWLVLPAGYTVSDGFAVSPDGLRICFGGAQGDLYLATLDEQKIKAVVRPLVKGGMSHHASFAPDGKRILFSWHPTGTKCSQLYIMDLVGDATPKLLPSQDRSLHNCDPDWSPDGKSIVFVSEPAAP